MIFSAGHLLEVGRVIKTHGYEGKLRFELFNGIEINQKEPIFMMFDHKPVPFFMTEISTKNPFIVGLQDVTTLTHAQQFLNKALYLPILDTDTDEDDDSVVGYQVVDNNLGNLGPVKEVIENSAQDLLLVTYGDKELLIPFVDAIVEDINDDSRVIIVTVPDGLIHIDQ